MLRILVLLAQFASFAIGIAIIRALPRLRLEPKMRLAVVAALCCLIALFNLIVSDPADLFGDFNDAYYPAGDAAVTNKAEIGELFEGVLGFVNIPIVAYLFAPFAIVDLKIASWIFSAIGFAMAVAAVLLIAREAALEEQRRFEFFFVAAAFGPLAYSIKEANTSHMILLALVVALIWLRRDRNLAAGVLLGAAAIIKLPLMLFGVYFLARRNWRALAGFAGICAATGLASLAIFGWDMHQRWFDECIRNFNANALGAFNVQSIAAFLIRLVEPIQVLVDWAPHPPGALLKAIGTGAALLIYVAAIAASLRNPLGRDGQSAGSPERRQRLEFLIIVGLAVLTSPLSWSHYYVLLLLPLGFLFNPSSVGEQGAGASRLTWLAVILMLPVVFKLEFPWEAMNELYAKLLVSHLLAGGLLVLALVIWARWKEGAVVRAVAGPAGVAAE